MSAEEGPASQDDPLPPWKNHPELPFGDIGWRMGYGESYLISWWNWADSKSKQYLFEYFKQYVPIPVDWFMWVAACLRGEQVFNEILGGVVRDFSSIRWLEEQGLANLAEFQFWFDNVRPRAW